MEKRRKKITGTWDFIYSNGRIKSQYVLDAEKALDKASTDNEFNVAEVDLYRAYASDHEEYVDKLEEYFGLGRWSNCSTWFEVKSLALDELREFSEWLHTEGGNK